MTVMSGRLRAIGESRAFWAMLVVTVAGLTTFLMSSVQAVAAPAPPTRVGINLPTPNAGVQARMFTNLAIYGLIIISGPDHKWVKMEPDMMGPNGWPSKIPAGGEAMLGLMLPPGAKTGTVIGCSWRGTATMNVAGNGQAIGADAHNIAFRLTADAGDLRVDENAVGARVRLMISNVTPADPIIGLDCREQGRPRDQIFDPEFIKALAPYKVVRFMDWMHVNNSATVDWAREIAPERPFHADDAVTLSDMIALSIEAKVDPWFTIPYTAPDDYVRRFAQMTHDRLPSRTVYVEVGNEMWNRAFGPSQLAMDDGLKAGLGPDPETAMLRQYALKSKHVLDIWTKVYADRPHKLVRVLSGRHASPPTSETLLGYKDVAKSVDALATAPYFGNVIYTRGGADNPKNLDEAFARLEDQMNIIIKSIHAQKAIADRYGKRYIAYEAGQHILIQDNPEILYQISHDPRIGKLYTRYLEAWKRDFGDTIMLYHMVGTIGRFGAWGLEEYFGQAPAATPKKQAVLEFIARNGKPD